MTKFENDRLIEIIQFFLSLRKLTILEFAGLTFRGKICFILFIREQREHETCLVNLNKIILLEK